MERNKPAIRGTEGGGGGKAIEKRANVREEANEIGNEETREWTR